MSERFTREDVERVAELARLELTPEEKDLLARQLADILAYARQVQDVDTTGVPPTSHALSDTSGMRDDVVTPSLAREDALAAAPEADAAAGLFKVPRVLG
jgi:aspartyl-tRNA(Asn)/glutamyl-tRNA(Gln) amidotransferase subunit C